MDLPPTPTGAIRHLWQTDYTMVYRSLPLIRLHARRQLAMWGWPGDQQDAVLIISELVTNAINYGRVVDALVAVRLAYLGSGGLLVDVSDAVGAFPDFANLVRGDMLQEGGRGLWLARRLGAELCWFLRDGGGKTVRAHLPGIAPEPGTSPRPLPLA
ncbi:ATP-binding protein [Streptomyces sp. NPDC050085]|uniref:ATP-binding protein n=1 Tax=Streptomyces sp. NPDC050085 TaxID=3365600 RepID=UPI0037A2F48B